MLYAAEIWGYKYYEQFERMHLFACKKCLHVRNKIPNDAVYGELGRYPLFVTATVRVIKHWLKLLMQPDNFYSRKKKTKKKNVQNITCFTQQRQNNVGVKCKISVM